MRRVALPIPIWMLVVSLNHNENQVWPVTSRRDDLCHSTLVVVSCGARKIWAKGATGKIPAKNAYIGPLFHVEKEYAEKFAGRWVILSAKYGFLDPDTPIEKYEVTFKDPGTNPISVHELQEQVKRRELDSFERAVVLGGKKYVERVEKAFEGSNVKIVAPLHGKRIGEMMSAVKKAIDEKACF